MTSRIQIALDSELQRKAKQRAGQFGISFAEYIRRLVARDLHEHTLTADPSVIFNLGESRTHIARDKDRLVAEAVEAEARRES